MLTTHLQKVMGGDFLTSDEAANLIDDILNGGDAHQAAALLALLRYRGETADEVAGMARAIRNVAIPVSLPYPTLDIVGTGGDHAHSVNISTGSAILAAACGIKVAKHGNRSVSSRSGSADVLEALGIDIEMSPQQLQRCVSRVGIGFLFAPSYHPAYKALTSLRRGLKMPTVLNFLGPLLNPAAASYALIGVANTSMLKLMADAILRLGSIKKALVFGGDGLDELAPIGAIDAYEVSDGRVLPIKIDPEALGFRLCSCEDLRGGSAADNAAILMEVFSGKTGPVADTLTLNVACALWIYGSAKTMQEGIAMARGVLADGKALQVVERWKQFSTLSIG